jgi:hypothetical protein
MTAVYSSNRYVCPNCAKTFRGVIPRGGDGSAYIFPRHNDKRGEYCRWSRSIIDEDKQLAKRK